MRIAIIGSGIAGLAAARTLKRLGNHVSLFEKQSALGMAAHGFEVAVGGQTIAGDLPSRMFNASLWPNVTRLYDDLGIDIEQVTATQNYRSLTSQESLRLTIPLTSWDKVTSVIHAPNRLLMLEMRRLQQQGSSDLKHGDVSGTFDDYLKRHQFRRDFRQQFLYPALTATVCTCSDKALGNYPAKILLKAMEQIVGKDGLWRVAQGSEKVVSALAESVDQIFFDTVVERVIASRDSAVVETEKQRLEFDCVICATQANHVRHLYPALATDALAIFNGFQYENVRVVVHTDSNVMPKKERDWCVFNFLSRHVVGDENSSMCSVWLNRFHRQWPANVAPIFQTIKPIASIAQENIICETTLQRPVVTADSWQRWQALKKFNSLSHRLKFCGSYAVPGIPLLESAVTSAQEVCDDIATAGSSSTLPSWNR